MREVTLLSSPQHAHAPTMSSDRHPAVAPGSHTSSVAAIVTNAAATIMFRPRYSRKTVAASTTVNTNSMFSSSDAEAADVPTRPAVNSAGPTAPPAMMAVASRPRSRRSASRDGRDRTHHGVTASAAPT